MGRSKTGTSALLAYPGFGYPTDDGHWRLYVSGVAWQEPVVFNIRQRMLIRMLGGAMKASPEDLQGELFNHRISPFMAEADQRRSIAVKVAGHSHGLQKTTRKNGHFRDFLVADKQSVESHIQIDSFGNRTLEYSVHLGGTQCEPATGLIYLLDEAGTSVISDIDDTIKDSAVGDRQKLLTNTFLRDFRSIAGMADVYQQWSERGASFHYVSSSPWQLYVALQEMNILQKFPAGTMHLRNFRFRDQFLKNVILRRQGKMTAIRFLIKNLPQRKFVLIGDSGEKDPEIYRKICRKYPDRIKALFIRDVQHRPLESERIRKLNETLPAGMFEKFRDAEELQALAERAFWKN